jgi:hypothetical protein
MRNIVFEITDNEQKVLDRYCMDSQEWIEKAVHHLVEGAKTQIYDSEVERILADPDVATLVTDRNEIVNMYSGPLKGNPNG